LLDVKPRASSTRTADERLRSNFEEINDFIAQRGRLPGPNSTNVVEFQLYSRLKGLQENPEKASLLKERDKYNLLPEPEARQAQEPAVPYRPPQEIRSVDDILENDPFGLLGDDDEGLFDFKHTPQDAERASADFVARRKPCPDFERYEAAFQAVQQDLASGKRQLIPFRQENLRPGDYYVHNGVLLYLENVDYEEEVQSFKSGKRVRKDGRTRTIFENGTESEMLYRSLYKALLDNGKAVTQDFEKMNEGFAAQFSAITAEDAAAGYIYVLRSKSSDPRIAGIKDLYKIGYSKTEVAERLKNAEKEPTFLMAKVEYIAGWKCYNLNPQKLEQLLHNFFGASCLDLDVYDEKGKRHFPREWFIAPLPIIERAIELIISGEIVHYRYDGETGGMVGR
jgi:hypothetical protein